MDDVKDTTKSAVADTAEKVEKPGDKTDPNLLLKSLQEERDKRREEQEKIKKLELELETERLAKSVEITEPISDEGKFLQKKISSLEETLALKDVVETYPALKDKSDEFLEFRKEYPGISLEKTAKIFLAEKDLLETPKTRAGLEKSSGGTRTTQQEMTIKEFDDLRNTNFRKYTQMIRDGKTPKG